MRLTVRGVIIGTGRKQERGVILGSVLSQGQSTRHPDPLSVLALSLSSVRPYSVYPKYYINPIYLPAEKRKLAETDELKKLAYVPVLPTNNDQNASVWHDPKIVKFTNHIMKMGYKELARTLVDKVSLKLLIISYKLPAVPSTYYIIFDTAA